MISEILKHSFFHNNTILQFIATGQLMTLRKSNYAFSHFSVCSLNFGEKASITARSGIDGQ
jgi:hypothetical protein